MDYTNLQGYGEPNIFDEFFAFDEASEGTENVGFEGQANLTDYVQADGPPVMVHKQEPVAGFIPIDTELRGSACEGISNGVTGEFKVPDQTATKPEPIEHVDVNDVKQPGMEGLNNPKAKGKRGRKTAKASSVDGDNDGSGPSGPPAKRAKVNGRNPIPSTSNFQVPPTFTSNNFGFTASQPAPVSTPISATQGQGIPTLINSIRASPIPPFGGTGAAHIPPVNPSTAAYNYPSVGQFGNADARSLRPTPRQAKNISDAGQGEAVNAKDSEFTGGKPEVILPRAKTLENPDALAPAKHTHNSGYIGEFVAGEKADGSLTNHVAGVVNRITMVPGDQFVLLNYGRIHRIDLI